MRSVDGREYSSLPREEYERPREFLTLKYIYYLNKMGLSRNQSLPLLDIWESEIMTNFEANWDYIRHRPTTLRGDESVQQDSIELWRLSCRHTAK
jgi:hypothetical protein